MVQENRNPGLTDIDDSLLIVIDVQEAFLNKLEKGHAQLIVNRIQWLVKAAAQLHVPIMATAENKKTLGGIIPEISQFFPPKTLEHDKVYFGLTGHSRILADVKQFGKQTAVLVGLETDVCVMQSAIGLLQQGFRVVALSDATASPGPCHEAGLLRMQNAGVIISTVKGLFYEWARKAGFAHESLDADLLENPPRGIFL